MRGCSALQHAARCQCSAQSRCVEGWPGWARGESAALAGAATPASRLPNSVNGTGKGARAAYARTQPPRPPCAHTATTAAFPPSVDQRSRIQTFVRPDLSCGTKQGPGHCFEARSSGAGHSATNLRPHSRPGVLEDRAFRGLAQQCVSSVSKESPQCRHSSASTATVSQQHGQGSSISAASHPWLRSCRRSDDVHLRQGRLPAGRIALGQGRICRRQWTRCHVPPDAS